MIRCGSYRPSVPPTHLWMFQVTTRTVWRSEAWVMLDDYGTNDSSTSPCGQPQPLRNAVRSCYSAGGEKQSLMIHRRMTGWHAAVLGIAVSIVGASRAAWAQAQAADAGDEGGCTANQLQLECPERCPNYTTCFIDEGQGQVYYRVDRERFYCDGLVCEAARQELDDYCCQRGEYAPSSGGGCGCRLAARDAPRSLSSLFGG